MAWSASQTSPLHSSQRALLAIPLRLQNVQASAAGSLQTKKWLAFAPAIHAHEVYLPVSTPTAVAATAATMKSTTAVESTASAAVESAAAAVTASTMESSAN